MAKGNLIYAATAKDDGSGFAFDQHIFATIASNSILENILKISNMNQESFGNCLTKKPKVKDLVSSGYDCEFF
jgi:hypothetical protein